jgi:drug/metabolite transporter (DMT)-like permease
LQTVNTLQLTFTNHPGEWASVLTAVFWTITALAFEAASKRIGSLSVNLLRLFVGFIFLTIFSWFHRGILLPFDASTHAWIYLVASGLIGFVIGDLCLFQAFVVMGARISMLMMALSPPMTAFLGYLVFGETLSWKSGLGMLLTLSGIALVVLKHHPDENGNGTFRRFRFNVPAWGIILGLGGALGQAGGLILSKIGMKGHDTFAATQIRVIAGIAGFSVLIFFLGKWKEVFNSLKQTRAMFQLSLGAFFGPFLGVSFSLISIKYADAGIAATIMAMVPVLIIVPSAVIYKEKINLREVAGALLAVCGVAMFFL